MAEMVQIVFNNIEMVQNVLAFQWVCKWYTFTMVQMIFSNIDFIDMVQIVFNEIEMVQYILAFQRGCKRYI